MPEMEQAYVKAGLVRIVYLHFAFLGEESLLAAQASECAGEQGAFWPFHDKLYQNQGGINSGAFSEENLVRFAGELGLDADALSGCLASGRYRDTVMQDRALGIANGVNSTPTIFITRGDEGTGVRGAIPFSEVEPIIEGLLGREAGE